MIDVKVNAYDLPTLPEPVIPIAFGPGDDVDRHVLNVGDGYLWSGKPVGGPVAVPAIGDRVTVKINGLGPGVVESYFHEHGYLGVKVKLDAPPEWHVKQTAGTKNAGVTYVFGAELD